VIIQAKLERGLFVWRPNDRSFIKKEQCYLANIKENASLHLWHLRMGHLNGDSLRSLKNMSEGMPNFGKDALPFCVACCRAKNVVKSFKGKSNRAQKTFDTIYVDLWGPMLPAMGGETYALLIVDEFSGYTWGRFLMMKSQAAEHIINFIRVQDRAGNRVQQIRSDRGGEFTSRVLQDFFNQMEIVHSKSPPYTPQYQGKVERMNRTVGEMAHAMRVGAKLETPFWSWAWETAIFLRNRSPTTSNEHSVTPYQVMTGEKPQLKNLLIFGARAEAHVPSEIRRKGEDRSRPGIFVRYEESSKAYRFLPDGEKRWVVVRSISCNEQLLVPSIIQEKKEWDLIDKTAEKQHLEIQEVDNQDEGQDAQEMAQPKEVEREPVVSAKSNRRITRSMAKKQLEEQIAMVVVDDLGGEHYVSGNEINLMVPKTITGALNGPEAEKWRQAIEDEMKAIFDAGILSEPVQVPRGTSIVNLKFIFVKNFLI
jgi:hypothetical protein